MDCSPPGSSVHGILQARRQEWVAMTPPGDLPEPGIKPTSLALAGRFFTSSATLVLLLGTNGALTSSRTPTLTPIPPLSPHRATTLLMMRVNTLWRGGVLQLPSQASLRALTWPSASSPECRKPGWCSPAALCLHRTGFGLSPSSGLFSLASVVAFVLPAWKGSGPKC